MKKYLLILTIAFLALTFCVPQANAASLWTLDFSTYNPPASVQLVTNYCWDMGNHLVFYSPDSSVAATFNLDGQNFDNYKLNLTDRGSAITMTSISLPGPQYYSAAAYSPYTIRVNNSTVADNVNLMWLNDKTTSYNIGKYLVPGKNTITITLSPGSTTRYEIRSIELADN